MKPLRVAIYSALLLVSALAHANSDFKEGEVEVKYMPGQGAAKYLIPARIGAYTLRENTDIGWYTLKLVTGVTTQQAVARLKAMPGVLAAEPNYYRHPLFSPNDTFYSNQYGPAKIGCESAWNTGLGTSAVTIAFVDTGISQNHPEFAGRIKVLTGCNIVDGNSDPSDTDGHGTHVAGIAAATTNNNQGIAGICGGATIMPIKVFDGTNGGTIDIVSRAYEFAANNHADVINASIGGLDYSQQEFDAATYAVAHGCIFAAAAGNDGTGVKEYPAGYEGVIAVAASDTNDAQTSYTNYGSWVPVAAPGDQIYSCWLGNTYQYDSGTSMACPHVAGAFALLKSYVPAGTDVAVIRNALLSTTDYIGTWVRYGRINVYSALQQLQQSAGGSVTAYPTLVNPFQGTLLSGDVTSLWTLDSSVYSLGSVSPGAGLQTATAQIEFLLPASSRKITSAVLKVASYGVDNSVVQVSLYNALKRSWTRVGQVALTLSGDGESSLTLPASLPRYAQNGALLLRLQAVTPSGTSPFTYNIDEAVINCTVANGPRP